MKVKCISNKDFDDEYLYSLTIGKIYKCSYKNQKYYLKNDNNNEYGYNVDNFAEMTEQESLEHDTEELLFLINKEEETVKNIQDRLTNLKENLKKLEDQLNTSKPIKVSELPDGWYKIEAYQTNIDYIQNGDILMIKDGMVYMKDHGRFQNQKISHDYTLKGISKAYWCSYTASKLN